MSLKSARDKAKRAKALQFAAQVHHALGAYAVGVWNFDDQTSPTADSSGYGNDGDLNNFPVNPWTADTPSGKGYALSFDGVNDYIDCGNDASLITQGSFSVVLWFKTSSPGSAYPDWSGLIARIVGGGNNRIFYRVGMLTFGIYDGTNNPTVSVVDVAIDDGVWHHVVAVRDVIEDKLKIYLDGTLKQSTTDTTTGSITGGSHINIGEAGRPFNGSIDDVRIYTEALSSAQVRKLYVKGAKLKELSSLNK